MSESDCGDVPGLVRETRARSITARSSDLAARGLDLLGENSLLFALAQSLALAIDAKDATAHSHLRRVQTCAVALARRLGVPQADVQGVRMAAALHDIGKLAVPEHVLSKPGPLTLDEFAKIRIHPQVGAEIISGVPFPYPVAELVLSHHERWDGKGYPSGLKREEIPLGARILSVVDYFDALVTERPHHRALAVKAALDLLRQEAGKALDPMVVETFITLYPELAEEVERENRQANGPSVLFQDIAFAHREMYALYEIAQAIGSSLGVADTMAALASKLGNIVPWSCCALFLSSDDNETLRCRFATGVEADAIQQLRIPTGHGLTGWVARNRRPLVNAWPRADFEAAGVISVETTLQSAVVCPLVFNERFIGTLSVYHTDASIYTDDHRRLLDRISEQAAAVIYNSDLFERTQEDALVDHLTGLPNTRFMFMYLARELPRAERLKSEVSIIAMDLDGFKQVNDLTSFDRGDLLLHEAASIFRTHLQPHDICVRWFSDKFIVVLSGCGAAQAAEKRSELQAAVSQLKTSGADNDSRVALRISAGTSTFPDDGRTWTTLIDAATRRMRADKRLHRH